MRVIRKANMFVVRAFSSWGCGCLSTFLLHARRRDRLSMSVATESVDAWQYCSELATSLRPSRDSPCSRAACIRRYTTHGSATKQPDRHPCRTLSPLLIRNSVNRAMLTFLRLHSFTLLKVRRFMYLPQLTNETDDENSQTVDRPFWSTLLRCKVVNARLLRHRILADL